LNVDTSIFSLNSPIKLSHATRYGLQIVPHQYDARPKCTKRAFHILSSKLNKSGNEGKIEQIRELLGSSALGGTMAYKCALLGVNL
jgi:hypothetical protein